MTNAAELLVRDRIEVIWQVDSIVSRIKQQIVGLIANRQTAIRHLIIRIIQSLSRQSESLRRYQELSHRLIILAGHQIRKQLSRVAEFERLLYNLDYRRVIKRGFSITLDAGGKVIGSISGVAPAAAISRVWSSPPN